MATSLQAHRQPSEGVFFPDSHPAGGNPLRGAFATRAHRAIDRLVHQMGESALQEAVAAPSDFGVLLAALESEPALAVLSDEDPLAQARLRGLQAKNRLLSQEGGVLGVQEVAELLNLSRQAIHKRARSGRLLALDCGRHGHAFPAWQFTEGGLLAGLEETLKALEEHDPWSRLAFFLSENAATGGQSPLTSLRQGKLDQVLRAARIHGEHGAV